MFDDFNNGPRVGIATHGKCRAVAFRGVEHDRETTFEMWMHQSPPSRSCLIAASA